MNVNNIRKLKNLKILLNQIKIANNISKSTKTGLDLITMPIR